MKEPISKILDRATDLKNKLYDFGYLKSQKLDVPIVCIGNLTFGGTGKTPVVQSLAKKALERRLKPSILLRGYKRSKKGALKVESNNSHKYGDEAATYFEEFNNVPIYVSEERVKGADEILKNENIDFIILDDGFQHRKIYRDLDVVLIDLSRPFNDLKVFPSGRAREGLQSLERAHAVVFTKSNFADESIRGRTLEKIPQHCKVFFSNSKIEKITNLKGQDLNVLIDPPKRIMLLSGLGNPDFFEDLIRDSFKSVIVNHLKYTDHHKYTSRDIKNILNRAADLDVDLILTTHKDSIKLVDLDSSLINIKNPIIGCIHQSIEFQNSQVEFYDYIFKSLL